MIRILIVEDEIIIARYLEQELTRSFPCETRIVLTPREASVAMGEMLPHLLLCDINLQEEETGIDLVNELRRKYAFEVIFITSYHSRSIIQQAAALQPANYIIKPIEESQLYACVQLVVNKIESLGHTGKALLPAATLFTETELRILRMIREKKTTAEIAAILNLSRYTVKNHRHAICRKLQLRDENNALLKWMMQNGNIL